MAEMPLVNLARNIQSERWKNTTKLDWPLKRKKHQKSVNSKSNMPNFEKRIEKIMLRKEIKKKVS